MEVRRRVGCLRPYLVSGPVGGDGFDPKPNTSGNEEKARALGWGFDPRMCEVSSVGAHQRTRGCSPRRLGGVLALVQGL